MEILKFQHSSKHIVFTEEGEMARNKHLKDSVTVRIALQVELGNTKN